MRLKIVALLLSFCVYALAQTGIEQMRTQRMELERKLADQEKILTSTETSIAAQLSNLNVLQARLEERNRVLAGTRKELAGLTEQQNRLSRQIRTLEKEYDNCRDTYAQACRFYQRQQTEMNALTFLLSSDSFRQLATRTRYLKEYNGSVYRLALQIEARKDTLEQKRKEVEELRLEKKEMESLELSLQQAAKREQQVQQQTVDKLKKKRSQLKKEIAAQQKKMDQLSKEIDRQIQLAMKESGNTSAGNDNRQNFQLSGNFESNKGKLPMPISGPYLVVGKYGISQVAGQKDVKQNNLGIDIQGQQGAKALCVFDGSVSGVFQHGKGQLGILVRHGKYITVYCNLVSTTLKKGDEVKAGAEIGLVQTSENGSPILHFQLHRESTRLNPQDWLRK